MQDDSIVGYIMMFIVAILMGIMWLVKIKGV
jgi:hypothetical protein